MHTERGLARIVGFTDGVVAIAITLLVLPLVESVAELDGNVGAFVAQNTQQLFAFVLSFAVIGNFWMVHHEMYEKIGDYNGALIWANMLWLLSIVFLPFPTEVLAKVGTNGAVTYLLYVGTLLVTTFASFLQEWILIRNPGLLTDEAQGTVTLAPVLIPLGIMVIALILALTIPGFGLWGLMLLFVSGRVQAIITKRKSKTT